MEATQSTQFFVLVREPSVGQLMVGYANKNVLSDRDNGKPLLFPSAVRAEEYFHAHAKGATMEQLQCSVRPATEENILRANIQGSIVSADRFDHRSL